MIAARCRRPASILAMMLVAFAMSLSMAASATRDELLYEVTVTNATFGQQFTPLLLVTHAPALRLFTIGEAASAGLATLAEEGMVAPLRAVLDADPRVNATEAGGGLTDPGKSTTLMVSGHPQKHRLSVAAMLIPTNDAFLALNGMELPFHGSVIYHVRAYDAGSEINDELCASIPGPFFAECGGPGGGAKVGNGEGFVHVHRGIHGVGDLDEAGRAWMNPVAVVRITRLQ